MSLRPYFSQALMKVLKSLLLHVENPFPRVAPFLPVLQQLMVLPHLDSQQVVVCLSIDSFATYHEVANFFLIQLTQSLCVKELKVMPLRHSGNSRFFGFCRTTLAHCLLEVI
nr:hypothetical protein Iba_chr14dCG15030 [Ipomoea batatas]